MFLIFTTSVDAFIAYILNALCANKQYFHFIYYLPTSPAPPNESKFTGLGMNGRLFDLSAIITTLLALLTDFTLNAQATAKKQSKRAAFIIFLSWRCVVPLDALWTRFAVDVNPNGRHHKVPAGTRICSSRKKGNF